MFGDVTTRSARVRVLPPLPRGRWSSWSSDVKRKRARARLDQAMLVERMSREESRARLAGRYVPGDDYRGPYGVRLTRIK